VNASCKFDWGRFASELEAIAADKMSRSKDMSLRSNAAGAAQEKMVGDVLRCIAIAVSAAQKDEAHM
jgi:hypothetical protein